MKKHLEKTFRKTLVVTFLSTIFFSCNSEDSDIQNLEKSEQQNTVKKSTVVPKLLNYELDNGDNVQVLSFSSWQDFQNLATDLDNQVEIFDDNFLRMNAHLSPDALSILEEETNYSDQVPLINYENSIAFTQALRKRFNIENERMLATENLDPNLDPNINLAFSGGELSLVNNNQEVMIADTIYVFKKGKVGKIFDNYKGNLSSARINDLASGNGISIFEPNLPVAECVGWRATESDHHYANGKNARRVAKIRAVPLYTKAEKMTINYEKNRRWKEKRTKMAVNLTVWLWEKCDNNSSTQIGTKRYHSLNTFKDKKRRDIHHHEYINSGTVKTRIGFLVGDHHYANTQTYYTLQ